MAALVKENKERKEREKQAKLKAIADERAAKMKEVEEEMKKKEKAAEEEAAAEEEKERMRIESGEGSSGGTMKRDVDADIEKKISEWVANLSLGEDEEAESYVTEDEKAALAAELAAMTDAMERRERGDEQKLQWKLRMKREKRRRREEVNKMTAAVAKVQECRAEDVALSAMRSGFREFARKIVTHIGGEVKQMRDNVGKYCEGAIEGAKAIAAAEGEGRPRKEPIKLKFPDTYGGEEEENFDNWEASVNSYIYLQHILTEEQVLVAFQALKDEATSFARSLTRAAGCENNLVAYSKVTPLSQFLKLLKERFVDPTRGVRASDKLQTIHSRQWRSARALKGTMDDLVAVPDHGVTEPQLVQLFYRAIPEALRGHFFDKSQQAGITYDALSREVVLYESKSMPVTTFWHKDLEKGKGWKGRTISGQVKAKDHMILTLEEGGTDEVPYSEIEWGLEDDGSSVGQGRSYAAIAAGGKPQGRGGGQGQRGQAMGGRGPGAQGVGGQGNRQAGGRGKGPPLNRQGNRSPQRGGGRAPQGGWHPGLPQGRPWEDLGLDQQLWQERVNMDNTLAHCCLSAPAFARLVRKEQLEEQVFIVYVRPVTEAQEKDSSTDPTIAKLLEKFKDLTESPTGVVPRPIQHRIEIEPGSRTPKGAIYRMSPRELEELRKQLDELLEKGWIRPSSSPFGAPVLFVPKKEGELRMCIDYRGLNAITVKNVEPLPRIDDLLDRVQGCKYFSKIDLKSGYHQIEVHPDDQYKTAFRTRYGHYVFIVMPFGLTNAPTTSQRCMNDLFRPWLDKFKVVYLNDILVFSKTLQEHQSHLRQILEKLREASFKINAKKCEWAKTQVLYLGHVLDGDGIKPEDSKIAAIRDSSIIPDQINWDEMLPNLASPYNNSVHLSTCRTPNELHKSFRPRRPFEGLNRDQIHRLPPGTREFAIQNEKELATVVENLRKAQHRMIEQANKHRRPSQFQVGDLVWVKAKEFAPAENIS
uniref:Reverse transcriptase domain-containing protein n=1 Tax=Chara braunii TaxID=69332 RepID=A0A388L5R7_CHABU